MIEDDLRQINHARPAVFLRRNVSNIGQNCLSNAAHHPNGSSAILPSGKDPGMSDPSPLVFEICTAIDRFQEASWRLLAR